MNPPKIRLRRNLKFEFNYCHILRTPIEKQDKNDKKFIEFYSFFDASFDLLTTN